MRVGEEKGSARVLNGPPGPAQHRLVTHMSQHRNPLIPDRLIRRKPDRLGMTQDTPTLLFTQHISEEESSGHVRDFDTSDGGAGGRGEGNGRRGRGEEEGWVKVGGQTFGAGSGLEEMEVRGEGGAVGGGCKCGDEELVKARRRGEEGRGGPASVHVPGSVPA